MSPPLFLHAFLFVNPCRCENVVHEAHALFSIQPDLKTQAVFTLASRLQTVVGECGNQLRKIAERRASDTTDTSALELHVQEAMRSLQLFISGKF